MAKIMVVDDKELWRRQVRESLERAGHEVLCFATAEEALEAFERDPWSFEVALLDMDLPPRTSMQGPELTDKIIDLRMNRGYGPLPQIICFTAVYLEPEWVVWAKEKGVTFITKDENYTLHVNGAAQSIVRARDVGPFVEIIHSSGEEVGSHAPYTFRVRCYPHEIISSVTIDGKPLRTEAANADWVVFDYIACYTGRSKAAQQTEAQIFNGMTAVSPYQDWVSGRFSLRSLIQSIQRLTRALSEMGYEKVLVNLSGGWRVEAWVKVYHVSPVMPLP